MTLPTNQEIGARLQGFALAVAPAVAFAYTAGFVTGSVLHSLNNKLVELTR
ncbi:hypothetical protein SCRES3_gp57 [Synechococcus phage S-CRES3]|nr:hypothetical protein SCRES3_gp57 [Synechococcus phage S-CRES3]